MLLYKKIILGMTMSLMLIQAFSQNESVFAKSEKALADKDFETYIPLGNRIAAVARTPYVLYNLAKAYAHTNKFSESLLLLNELADKGLFVEVENEEAFASFKNQEELIQVIGRLKRNQLPVDKSDTAFVLNDRTIIPEGIAVDEKTGTFYISSLSKEKVLQKKNQKPETDFVKTSQEGIWATLGMKVNTKSNELWVCSSAEKDSIRGNSGIFVFDIATGLLKHKFVSDNKTEQHLFNDLAFHKNDVYFTDSQSGKVFVIRDKKQPEVFTSGFIYPNGIVVDEKSENLFVADYTGMNRIALQTRKTEKMKTSGNICTEGVDGLYYYKGNLLAVQNGVGEKNDRIVRFVISQDRTTIEKLEVLQSYRHDFNIPTTGTIYKNTFYYIANSNLRNLLPDGSVTQPNANSVILKFPLD